MADFSSDSGDSIEEIILDDGKTGKELQRRQYHFITHN